MDSEADGGMRNRKSGDFRGSEGLFVDSVLSVVLWLGLIHFNVSIVLSSFLFLPLLKAVCVIGLLLILMVIPVDDQSKWGRTLARYICKHAADYFPMNLYVEDVNAFDPNEAYVFGYEPHSVWAIGVVVLGDLTGLMALKKIKLLASSAVFYAPLLRHIWSWMGFSPATRENFRSLLALGYSCVIVPGEFMRPCICSVALRLPLFFEEKDLYVLPSRQANLWFLFSVSDSQLYTTGGSLAGNFIEASLEP